MTGSSAVHHVKTERRWNGWRVWCTCSDYGIYDDEGEARDAAATHSEAFAGASEQP